MGRRQMHSGGYEAQNTCVQLVASPEDAEFSRNARTMSANSATSQQLQAPQDEKYMAQTPSPFLHPAQAPYNINTGMQQLAGYDLPGAIAPSFAFGDLPADFDLNGFDENQANYSQAMMYDPATGMYMAYDWQMQYNQGCYPMMGEVQGNIGEDFQQIGGCMQMPMQQNDSNAQAEHLLAALSEKLAASKGPLPEGTDGTCYGGPGYGENSLAVPEVMGGPCDVLPQHEAYNMHQSAEMQQSEWPCTGAPEHGQQHSERGGRKNRNDRHRDKLSRSDRIERGDYGDPSEWVESCEIGKNESAPMEASQQHGPVTFTTVMFRNIPNKYTREMLVKQLEQDLKGMFDFVYLPIDFKNKCNVGYAFINFRTIEACETFLMNFNGVEVRKCLPGLNSRKVTEVTPARVQGFEENVQRLRNSPVMRELAHHMEWMPLIFDEYGDQQPFPTPERPLEHIKPRRRGREDGRCD